MQYLLIGWEFLSIFQPSPTQCLDQEWVCPRCFTCPPPPPHTQYHSSWEGAGNRLHCQIKLRISTNTGDSRPGETYPNLSALPEEVNGLKGPLLVPKLQFLMESSWRKEVHSGFLHGRHNCQLKKKKKDVRLESCKLNFICSKMRTATPETASQIALRDCSQQWGKVYI